MESVRDSLSVKTYSTATGMLAALTALRKEGSAATVEDSHGTQVSDEELTEVGAKEAGY
jgi:hypothetical protein